VQWREQRGLSGVTQLRSWVVVAVDRRIRIAAVAALLVVGVTLSVWGETMLQAAAAANHQAIRNCNFSCPGIATPNPVYGEIALLGVAIMVAAILLGAFMVRAARRKTAILA
jgi:hypothetical protein